MLSAADKTVHAFITSRIDNANIGKPSDFSPQTNPCDSGKDSTNCKCCVAGNWSFCFKVYFFIERGDYMEYDSPDS